LIIDFRPWYVRHAIVLLGIAVLGAAAYLRAVAGALDLTGPAGEVLTIAYRLLFLIGLPCLGAGLVRAARRRLGAPDDDG
jgi:hypothetical protein